MKTNPFISFGKFLKEWITDRYNLNTLLIYILLPFFLNLILESFERKSFFGGFVALTANPVAFLCNMLIILFTLSISFLFRRRIFSLSILSIVWIVFGIANFILLSNRVTPFTGYDLKLISDALGVLKKYLNTFQLILVGILAVATLVGLFFVFTRMPKLKKKVNYLKALFLIAFTALLMTGGLHLGIRTGHLEERFGELSQAYLRNGFVYCFTNSLVDTGVDKPADYSPESISKLVFDKVQPVSTESAVSVEKKDFTGPNVIFLQLESFFDVSRLKDTTFSEDPLVNFHALSEQYPSGALSVPVVGAGTVNTEFEILTGMNMDDFGAGEYPFKEVLRKNVCESIAFNLKPHGYATHAVHNHTGRFYGRNIVYGNLGIDTFTSLEYMYPIETTPMNWCKDHILIQEIAKCLDDTTEQDFICTISVQGHGSYPSDADYEPKILVNDCYSEEKKASFQYYVNQLHEMDLFIRDLTSYLTARGEETILVMYGDHLPSLDISNEDLTSGDIYTTEYIIWNNIGLNLAKEPLEAFQLNSRVLQAIDVHDGVVNAYHQTNYGTENYLSGLAALEYDILYGDKLAYDGTSPYTASQVQMGIDPIEISAIYPDPFNSKYVVIKGHNFTKYSKVYVNGEKFSTILVDDETLRIKHEDLSEEDSFYVQQSKLTATDEVLFIQAKTIFDQAFENADFTTRQIILDFGHKPIQQ